MWVASKVGNLPSKFGHSRSLGYWIICYVRDGRTEKSNAYCPLPYGGGHNKNFETNWDKKFKFSIRLDIARFKFVLQLCYKVLDGSCRRHTANLATGMARCFWSELGAFCHFTTVLTTLLWFYNHYTIVGLSITRCEWRYQVGLGIGLRLLVPGRVNQGRRWVTLSDPWPTEYLTHDPYDPWPMVEHSRWCCQNVLVIHCDNERSEIKQKKSIHARLSDYHALEIGMPSERWTVKTHTISWQKGHKFR